MHGHDIDGSTFATDQEIAWPTGRAHEAQQILPRVRGHCELCGVRAGDRWRMKRELEDCRRVTSCLTPYGARPWITSLRKDLRDIFWVEPLARCGSRNRR